MLRSAVPAGHGARPRRETFGLRKVGFAGVGGHSVTMGMPVISEIRSAMRADLAVPAITCETMERETFSSSATAAGVVPVMRIAALISSGCTVVGSNSTC